MHTYMYLMVSGEAARLAVSGARVGLPLASVLVRLGRSRLVRVSPPRFHSQQVPIPRVIGQLNTQMRVRDAHDGFGIALCTTVACILSITAASWGPWSQTDMHISEEENVATYSDSGELTVSGSEEVWGAEFLPKCLDCKPVTKITMTRSPSDWCVTIKQLVFQPWEFPSGPPASRRLESVKRFHTNYTTWKNSSCLSDMGSYLNDNICNSTWVDLRTQSCDKAQTEIDAFPNATAYPFAFVRRPLPPPYPPPSTLPPLPSARVSVWRFSLTRVTRSPVLRSGGGSSCSAPCSSTCARVRAASSASRSWGYSA